ncbi:unnamed protein product [Musa textilis]
MNVDESFLVQFILNSLPSQFGPFKIHYNTNKDKWDLNELTSMCVQEELRLRQESSFNVMTTTQGVGSKKRKRHPSKKFAGSGNATQTNQRKAFTVKCFFCGKKGHMKKDCIKRKTWFEKKGINMTFVCFESNITEVPSNTWWIDSGASTHVTNNMQGFLSIRKPKEHERFIIMGNRLKAKVVSVGTYRLRLETGHLMDLIETCYVPTISRNLVSLSRIDELGYCLSFGNGKLRYIL